VDRGDEEGLLPGGMARRFRAPAVPERPLEGRGAGFPARAREQRRRAAAATADPRPVHRNDARYILGSSGIDDLRVPARLRSSHRAPPRAPADVVAHDPGAPLVLLGAHLRSVARASAYRLLAKALNLAVREGVLDRSPLKAIPRPKVERPEIRPLPIEEVEALADAIEPRYRLAVLLAAYLGLRAGEIGGLRLEDLDLERATLRVIRATRRDGGKRVLGDVKTPAGRRRISIPTFLVGEIRRHVDTYPPSADERLITTSTGGLVVSTILLRAFVEAASRLGLRRPRFHDLRHSAASLMIAEGAHPKVIQTRLGHSNIQVTLDIYGHLFPSLDAALAAQLDTARSRATSPAS
jgi:integrase